MLSIREEAAARRAVLEAVKHIGRALLPHEEVTERLRTDQRQRLQGRNLMTPSLIGWRSLSKGNIRVELSLGDFMNEPIYGVTVFHLEAGKTEEDDHKAGTCCHSAEEVAEVLTRLNTR